MSVSEREKFAFDSLEPLRVSFQESEAEVRIYSRRVVREVNDREIRILVLRRSLDKVASDLSKSSPEAIVDFINETLSEDIEVKEQQLLDQEEWIMKGAA